MEAISGAGGGGADPIVGAYEEKVTPEQVEALMQGAERDVPNGKFGEAAQKIARLLQIYHKSRENAKSNSFYWFSCAASSPVSGKKIAELFRSLCRANRAATEPLVSLLSNSPFFTINILEQRGSHYKIHVKEEGRTVSFSLPIRTSVEGQELLDELDFLLLCQKFEDLEKKLPRLANLSALDRINQDDFSAFYVELLKANCAFAMQHAPLFEQDYVITVRGDTLQILDKRDPNKWSFSFKSEDLIWLDCDAVLAKIAKDSNPFSRFLGYTELVQRQHERAPEVLELAERDFKQLEKPNIMASFALMLCYSFEDKEKFMLISSEVEKRLDQIDLLESMFIRIALLGCYAFYDQKSFARFAADLERKVISLSDSEDKFSFLAKIADIRALEAMLRGDGKGLKQWTKKAQECAKHMPASKQKEQLRLIARLQSAAAVLSRKMQQGAPAQKV